MLIRPLDPIVDLPLIEALYAEATEFWQMTDRKPPTAETAAAFFTDGPPGCDPAKSHRLGLFEGDQLGGVAELSFGFPAPQDAYLGLMLLAPRTRGQGYGAAFLAHIEALARAAQAPQLFLAVLAENSKGRAFWDREGFVPTGQSRYNDVTDHWIHRLVKPL